MKRHILILWVIISPCIISMTIFIKLLLRIMEEISITSAILGRKSDVFSSFAVIKNLSDEKISNIAICIDDVGLRSEAFPAEHHS